MKRKLLLIVLSLLLSACMFGGVLGAIAEEEQSSENIHPGFTYGVTGMWGTWEQKGSDLTDGTKLVELSAKTFATESTAPNEAAIRFSDEVSGYLTGEYDITFDIKVADNKNAGIIIAGESSNGKPLPYTNSLYVIVKNNGMFLFNNGTQHGNSSYTAAAGSWLNVNVFTEIIDGVTYYTVVVKNGDTQLAKIDRLSGAALTFRDDGIRTFVAGEATPASFRNVVIQKGARGALSVVYKAFPFAESEIPGAVEYVSGLDPNLTIAYGSSFESESDGKFFRATGFHPDIAMATAYSNFAGAYGKDFTLTFDVKTPSKSVYEKEDDANAGFMFRGKNYANPYDSAVYVRVEKNVVRVVNSAKTPLDQVVYAVPSDAFGFGAYVTLDITVKNETLTVGVKNAAQQSIALKKTREITEGEDKGKLLTFEQLTDVEAVSKIEVGQLPAYEATQYAGFTASHGACFKNIVMKDGTATKNFQLYPVDASRVGEAPVTKFVMAKENAADVSTVVREGNTKLLKKDTDLIGTIYENAQIFYFTYDGTLKDINVVNEDGTPLDSKYSFKLYFNAPPTFSVKEEWKGSVDVNYQGTSESRYGIDGVIVDKDGYIYAQLNCVVRMLPKEVTLGGVTVKDREWDGTRWVETEGGSLSGIIDGDQVGFEIVDAVMEDSDVGNNKPVTLEIALNGADASNYTVVLDSPKTVNIAEAGGKKNDSNRGCGGAVAASATFLGLALLVAGTVLLKKKSKRSR